MWIVACVALSVATASSANLSAEDEGLRSSTAPCKAPAGTGGRGAGGRDAAGSLELSPFELSSLAVVLSGIAAAQHARSANCSRNRGTAEQEASMHALIIDSIDTVTDCLCMNTEKDSAWLSTTSLNFSLSKLIFIP